jgi:NADPH-dependent 2,4-dienoyl-CoA reductase/sulfur reductase-like enzyme
MPGPASISGNHNDPGRDYVCDVLVLSSGAAGLVTAIAAKLRGLNVPVVEKVPVFGGTSAAAVLRNGLRFINEANSYPRIRRRTSCGVGNREIDKDSVSDQIKAQEHVTCLFSSKGIKQ